MKKIIRRNIPLASNANIHPHSLLNRLFTSRGISSKDEINYALSNLLPYDTLTDIDKAVIRLASALERQEKIIIIGDYDTDGATSTALAIRALKAFGAKHVDFLLPDRFVYGYGLTPAIVREALKRSPDLLITVDNGISSMDGVKVANAAKVDVLITDHHLAPKELPAACAIVNPNQIDDHFQSKSLAGVGVIFYVMIAFRAKLKKNNWFEKQNIPIPNMAELLDLVALGTVADVVPLDQNNRILIHQGILRIRAGKASKGILALLKIAKRDYRYATSSDLAFTVAPRLNAAGRLEDMSLGVRCLLAESESQAKGDALQLNELNQERKSIELKMQQEAFAAIEKVNLTNTLPIAICLAHPSWHQGIVGLIASRIKEKTGRPVIAFAKVSENELKGSARSISGFHIRDALSNIAAQDEKLILKFGGHAMAAGLSVSIQNYRAFTQALAKEAEKQLKETDLSLSVETDGELDSQYFNVQTAEILRDASPWGQGFPEPIFDGKFEIIKQEIVGQKHLKLLLKAPNSERYIDTICFHINLEKWPNYHCQHVRLVYRLVINEYNDLKRVQLLAEEISPVNI